MGRGVQCVLVKLRGWSEPRVAGLCFPFQGKRKKNNPFMELKIELRAGQAVAWKGGDASSWG